MDTKRNMTIILISTTIIALIAILFPIGSFQEKTEKALISDTYKQLGELSKNNKVTINTKIEDQYEKMDMLAFSLSGEDLRGEKVKAIMNKTVELYGFLRCAITFPDGSFVTHDGKNDGNVTQDPFYIRGFQGKSTLTGPRSAIVDETKKVVLLTVPVFYNNEIIALVTCTCETQYLEKAFQITDFEGRGGSYITGIEGDIISKPQSGGLLFEENNILTFFEKQFPDSYHRVRSDMQKMQKGTMILDVNGREEYVSYQPLEINDWYVFAVISRDTVDSHLTATLQDVYLLAISIAMILILLMILMWFYMRKNQQKAEKVLQKLAYCDDLTGIPNRNLFEKEARRILPSCKGTYAYIILNINKFKIINDIFGFAKGDEFLKHIAAVVAKESMKDEVCARFDADNFHILSHYSTHADLSKRMMEVAKKINAYRFDQDTPSRVSVGFGIYIVEDSTLPISSMGDKARMALYQIKGIHSPTTYFYDEKISNQLLWEQEVENNMQAALAKREMKLYLQPKHSVASEEITSAEVLVRWQRVDGSIVMPDEFIGLFEQNGFIVQLDMYMLDRACEKLHEWKSKGMQIIPISVNQSRLCLYQKDYIQKLRILIDKYAISPSFIELEITERALLEDTDTLISIIEQLHKLGFKIAIDDFGVGYSSLNMLQEILVDVLKIDKNFFRESINSERGKKIVTNIIAMANDLDIEVVAEGIETEEQLSFLKEIKCESAQGFYFSKAIAADIFEERYCKASNNNPMSEALFKA